MALHQQNPAPGFVGLISAGVSPVEVAQNAIEDARSACMRTYGSAPEVHVYGDPNFTFAYIFLPNLIESISFIPSLLSIGLHFATLEIRLRPANGGVHFQHRLID